MKKLFRPQVLSILNAIDKLKQDGACWLARIVLALLIQRLITQSEMPEEEEIILEIVGHDDGGQLVCLLVRGDLSPTSVTLSARVLSADFRDRLWLFIGYPLSGPGKAFVPNEPASAAALVQLGGVIHLLADRDELTLETVGKLFQFMDDDTDGPAALRSAVEDLARALPPT